MSKEVQTGVMTGEELEKKANMLSDFARDSGWEVYEFLFVMTMLLENYKQQGHEIKSFEERPLLEVVKDENA